MSLVKKNILQSINLINCIDMLHIIVDITENFGDLDIRIVQDRYKDININKSFIESNAVNNTDGGKVDIAKGKYKSRIQYDFFYPEDKKVILNIYMCNFYRRLPNHKRVERILIYSNNHDFEYVKKVNEKGIKQLVNMHSNFFEKVKQTDEVYDVYIYYGGDPFYLPDHFITYENMILNLNGVYRNYLLTGYMYENILTKYGNVLLGRPFAIDDIKEKDRRCVYCFMCKQAPAYNNETNMYSWLLYNSLKKYFENKNI
jgi:hypothetical protein